VGESPVTLRALVMLALTAAWAYTLHTADHAEATPAMQAFLNHLSVFALACFIGWQVIWNVTAALHTPLMSVTNAISGIILVGGMLQSTSPSLSASSAFGGLAVLLAMINVVGGFAVTQRMLSMFKR
jgi:H+-translocating NAD(P) transhydrogenase subunit alpha